MVQPNGRPTPAARLAQKQARQTNLIKRTAHLFRPPRSPPSRAPPEPYTQDAKVFCFFFSKKKALLLIS
jgi:hypothetical protein